MVAFSINHLPSYKIAYLIAGGRLASHLAKPEAEPIGYLLLAHAWS